MSEKANDKQVLISKQNAGNALAQLVVGPYTLTLRVPGANRAAKNATTSAISFAGSTANDSFAVVPTPDGLEFSATLANANAPANYQIALNTHGLVASLDPDGLTIDLTDPTAANPAAIVGTIGAPALQEATGPAVAPSVITVSVDPKATSLQPGETMLTYAINRTWLQNPARSFPIVLDPTACMAYLYSYCALWNNGTTDTFVLSGTKYAGEHQVGWTVDRVGNSSYSDGYGLMRTLLWWNLPQLPDGYVITNSILQVAQYWNGGSAGEKIHATLNASGFNINTDWAHEPSVWGNVKTPSLSACGVRNCWLDFDATNLTRAWYGHNGTATNFGVTLTLDNENQGELQLDNYTDSTTYRHPQLEITYVASGYKMAFDPALGPDFAPSTMAAGTPMTLPTTVTNIAGDSSGNWGPCSGTGSNPADCWSLGYRWYNAVGTIDSSGKLPIPASVSFGTSTATPLPLVVSPPTGGVGQYTLRLDMVHTYNGTDMWSSDWAQQATYYARAMVSSSPSNVHWAGLSPVERDEYPISVVASLPSGGTTQSVRLPDGSTAAIDLWTKNLTYSGSTGLGFADLGTNISLDWYYSAADVSSIPGVTGAAGWYTNYDERLEPGNGGAAYGYRDSSDNVHPVNYSGDGAITSGTAARLERPRITVFDENNIAGSWSGAMPALTTDQAKTGNHSLSIPATATGAGDYINVYAGPLAIPVPTAPPTISLNAYPNISFAVRSSTDSGVGLGIQVTDTTTKAAAKWFVYTVGTDWTLPTGYTKLNKPSPSPTGSWVSIYDNALASVAAAFGTSATDSYTVNKIALISRGGSGSTDYFDAISFQGGATSLSSSPAWNNGSGAYVGTETTDLPSATSAPALQVNKASFAASPQCYSTCKVGGSNLLVALGSSPYATWGWKKVGGTTLAAAFHVFDSRTNDTGNWITYYAGPTAPPGAINPIQVSPTVPTNWTSVTRNVLEDTRQLFKYYNDNPGGATANSLTGNLPATPDPVTLNGFALDGGDAGSALFDPVSVQSLPNLSGAGSLSGDDFLATYADGEIHHFNSDGILTSVTDSNGNATKLAWSYDANLAQTSWKWTGSPYSLTSVQAPSNDATMADGTPHAIRAIGVTPATGSSCALSAKCVRFTEEFGTSAVPETGRSAEFDTNSGSDMAAIVPARLNDTCKTSAPSGCLEFAYTGAATHLLNVVYDPRGVGGTTPDATQATTIGYDANSHPTSITDAGGTRLRIYPSATSGAYVRVFWQDATDVLSATSEADDLTPSGGVVRSWAPAACGTCASAGTPVDLAAAYKTDGLGAYTSQIKYRTGQGSLTTPCTVDSANQTPAPGSCGNPEVSRTGTFAARAVDNYGDPIAGGETAWSQSPEQYAASYAAGSLNLYRTSFSYDGFGRTLDKLTPSQIDVSTYATQVKATAGLDHYYRLNDTGTTAVDALGSPGNGTISGATSGATGVLVHDTDAALGFNGTNAYVQTKPESISGTFSVEAWVKPSSVSSTMTIAGSRGHTDYTFDIQIVPGVGQQMLLHADIGDGTKWMTQTADASIRFAANQWYQIVYVVTPDGWAIYVDGRQLNSGRYDLNGGSPMLGDGTTAGALMIGKTGASSAPAYFAGSIDEFAIYTAALDARAVAAHYAAAGATALDDAQTIYDNSGNPIQNLDNFVGNPGFEQGLADWTASNASMTSPGASGQCPTPPGACSQSAVNLAAGGSVSQILQIVPGQKVRLQLALAESGGTAQISMGAGMADGSYGSVSGMPQADPSPSGTWHTVAWDVPLPLTTGTSASTGLVQITIKNTGSGTVSVDDVAVFTTYGSSTYATNGLIATQTAISGATGSNSTTTASYSYSVPDSGAGSNLLTNGGFASDKANWTLDPNDSPNDFKVRQNDATTTPYSWTLRDGDTTGLALSGGNYGSTASIHVTSTDPTDISQSVGGDKVKVGDTYSLSGLVANHRLTCVHLRLFFKDAGGNPLGLVEAPCTTLTGGPDRAGWAYQTLSAVAPAGAVSVVVQVQGKGPFVGGSDGYVWADELRLVDGPTPEPYLPHLAATPAIFATSVTMSGGTGADQNVTASSSVDRWGRTLVSVDPDGMGSMTQYAANQTDVSTRSDGAGDVVQTISWDALGNPTETMDAVGRDTRTSYAFSGKPLDATAAYGTTDASVTETLYDEAGRLVSSDANKAGAKAPADVMATTSYTYGTTDPVGNAITTIADAGIGDANAATVMTYDLAGDPVNMKVYTGPGATGQAHTTTSYFDAAGRPTGTQDPIAPNPASVLLCPGSTSAYCNSVTSLDINGYAIDSWDAYGVRTHTNYDLAGRTVRTIASYVPGAHYTSTQNIATDTAFDSAERPLAVTTYLVTTSVGFGDLGSANAYVTYTSYDAFGRSVSVTQPDGSWTHTVYTLAGRTDRTSRPGSGTPNDANVAWTRNLYDAAGRQTTTLSDYDISGAAGIAISGFEAGSSGWDAGGSASFLSGGRLQ